MPDIDNNRIGGIFDEVADLLDRAEGDNAYRARTYRRAAGAIRQASEPLADMLERDGVEGLRQLPGIGEKFAGVL